MCGLCDDGLVMIKMVNGKPQAVHDAHAADECGSVTGYPGIEPQGDQRDVQVMKSLQITASGRSVEVGGRYSTKMLQP